MPLIASLLISIYMSRDGLDVMEIAILLTAIAALLTSVITMLTVMEMRRQRIVSHMPIIKILGGYSSVDIDQYQQWQWGKETLLINNYGKGVALDVSVKWDVKIDSIIEILKKYDPYNTKDIYLKRNILSLDNSVHMIDRQSEMSFPALNVSLEKSNELMIPSYILTAFEKFITESVINRPGESGKGASSYDSDTFPIIKIEISYADINGNEYVKTFALSLSPSIVQMGSEKKSGSASVVFGIEEVTKE